MFRIILLFLAFSGLQGARHPCPQVCNCPLPGSYVPSESESDDKYGETYYYPESDPSSETPKGICGSNKHLFFDKCWLDVHNAIFPDDVVEISDPSFCNRDNCICDPVDPVYNPICVLDTETGELTTVSNLCQLNCLECSKDVLVVHCGPCEVNCTEIETRLNCLGPPPPCKNDPELDHFARINAVCICPLIFLPVCTIDPKNGDLITFSNSCSLNCAIKEGAVLELLYKNGTGSCPCT